MDNSIYLFAAFGITWSILFIYVFRLFLGQKALTAKLTAIQNVLREKEAL